MPCNHARFTVVGIVVKMPKLGGGQYALQVKAQCAHCGNEMEFQGLPVGGTMAQPMVSPDNRVASIPGTMSDKLVFRVASSMPGRRADCGLGILWLLSRQSHRGRCSHSRPFVVLLERSCCSTRLCCYSRFSGASATL